MFEILNIHGILKCLTRAVEGLGPPIDIEVVKSFAMKSNYRVSNRKIPTPRGPLFEYVFYEEPSPENKIFFSRNGFSVDAASIPSLLGLIKDAYEWYEVATHTPSFKPVAESTIECFVHSPKLSPINLLKTLFPAYKKKPIDGFSKQLYPLSISLTSTYYPKKEKDSFIITVEPFVKSPANKFRVMVAHKAKNIDEALEHVQKLEKNIVSLLGKLFSQR